MVRMGLVFLAAAVAAAQPQAPEDRRPLAGMSVVFSVELPLDVPGAVLQPGVYVLKVKREPARAGDLAQLELWDAAETSRLAEFFAIQTYYPSLADNSVLTYYGGPPERRILKAWNLLSVKHTQWIAYPRAQAAELSKVTAEAVIAMPAGVDPEPTATATADRTPEPRALPVEFPKTAGNLPLVLWVAFTALAAFVVFRIYRADPAAAQNARNHAIARRAAAAVYRAYRQARAGKATQA
jgi:hypothetical protein